MSTFPIAPNLGDEDYNPIFEQLVDGDHNQENELIGIVAYGLYKQSKREWSSRIRSAEGRGPDSQELKAYVASWTPSRINGLRTEAAEILASFSGYVIETERPNILKDALKGRFWPSVVQSMIATLLFTVLLLVLYLILNYFGVPLPSFANT